MPPANHYINPLVTTGILRPAIPNTAITTASSIGSNAVRDSSYYVQEDRWPTPRSAEAQPQDDSLFDPIARSPPPFIVIRVSRSPAAADSSGTTSTPDEEKETDEDSKENENQAATSTATRPAMMAERKPYDGGGIVPPHIRSAIAESKNASTEAAPAKTPETNPAAEDISAEEFTRSGFVPAYVLKNIATSEASTAEQRADAQGTLDQDTARRARGKDRDAEGQGEK